MGGRRGSKSSSAASSSITTDGNGEPVHNVAQTQRGSGALSAPPTNGVSQQQRASNPSADRTGTSKISHVGNGIITSQNRIPASTIATSRSDTSTRSKASLRRNTDKLVKEVVSRAIDALEQSFHTAFWVAKRVRVAKDSLVPAETPRTADSIDAVLTATDADSADAKSSENETGTASIGISVTSPTGNSAGQSLGGNDLGIDVKGHDAEAQAVHHVQLEKVLQDTDLAEKQNESAGANHNSSLPTRRISSRHKSTLKRKEEDVLAEVEPKSFAMTDRSSNSAAKSNSTSQPDSIVFSRHATVNSTSSPRPGGHGEQTIIDSNNEPLTKTGSSITHLLSEVANKDEDPGTTEPDNLGSKSFVESQTRGTAPRLQDIQAKPAKISTETIENSKPGIPSKRSPRVASLKSSPPLKHNHKKADDSKASAHSASPKPNASTESLAKSLIRTVAMTRPRRAASQKSNDVSKQSSLKPDPEHAQESKNGSRAEQSSAGAVQRVASQTNSGFRDSASRKSIGVNKRPLLRTAKSDKESHLSKESGKTVEVLPSHIQEQSDASSKHSQSRRASRSLSKSRTIIADTQSSQGTKLGDKDQFNIKTTEQVPKKRGTSANSATSASSNLPNQKEYESVVLTDPVTSDPKGGIVDASKMTADVNRPKNAAKKADSINVTMTSVVPRSSASEKFPPSTVASILDTDAKDEKAIVLNGISSSLMIAAENGWAKIQQDVPSVQMTPDSKKQGESTDEESTVTKVQQAPESKDLNGRGSIKSSISKDSNLSFEKLLPIDMDEIFSSASSPLVNIDLQDLISLDIFANELEPSDRAALFDLLPEIDRKDGKTICWTLQRNIQLRSCMHQYQRLLGSGTYDPNQISRARNKRRRMEGWDDKKEKDLEARYGLRVEPVPAKEGDVAKWKALDDDFLNHAQSLVKREQQQ